MGEALIIRSGGGYSNGGYIPVTKIITVNETFAVPKAKGQQFSIRLFGGGGGMSNTGGAGGGGNMNYGILTLNEGERVEVIIGINGVSNNNNATNGGTTSFGTYLSATGGECGNDTNGGNGGAGGGGSGYTFSTRYGNGGHGTYGGGGGQAHNNYYTRETDNESYTNKNLHGGNGGTYGGGGGGFICGKSDGNWGNGGEFRNEMIDAEDGYNTIGKELDFEGYGVAGLTLSYKNVNNVYTSSLLQNKVFAGGGGYGGNGGYGGIGTSTRIGFGGGGGYGARGGNGGVGGGGGGGGYGNNGGDAYSSTTSWGRGGGGGGYGPEGYGHGGGYNFDSKSGICIISYMQAIQS